MKVIRRKKLELVCNYVLDPPSAAFVVVVAPTEHSNCRVWCDCTELQWLEDLPNI